MTDGARLPCSRVQLRVLGGVRVSWGAAERAVTGKPALLLAVLAAARGWVSPATVRDEVWPVGAHVGRTALYELVRRVRVDELGDTGRELLQSGRAGYRLRFDGQWLDLAAFDQEYAEAQRAWRARGWERSVARARQALELWPAGPPFGELASHGALVVESRRLRERRQQLVLALADGVARHGVPVGDLEGVIGLVAESAEAHPLDELLWCGLARLRALDGHAGDGLECLDELTDRLVAHGREVSPGTLELRGELRAGARRATLAVVTAAGAPSENLLDRSRELLAVAAYDRAAELARSCVRALPASPETAPVRAAAWLLVEEAAAALGDRGLLCRAAVAASRAALQAGDDTSLAAAVLRSLRVRLPGERDRALARLLAAALPAAAPRRAVTIRSALAVHGAGAATPDERRAATEAAVRYGREHGDDDVLRLGLRCWLSVASGGPDLHDQLAACEEALDLAPTRRERLALVADRAALQLAAADLAATTADLVQLEQVGESLDDVVPQAAAARVRACLATAAGEVASASAHITRAAYLLRGHPSYQELAFVQRWWLELDREPGALLRLVESAADRPDRPAYRAMLGYTYLRLGRLDEVRRLVDGLWTERSGFAVPEGSTRAAALAAYLEMAAEVGDQAAVRRAFTMLSAYRRQPLLTVAGTALVLGATSRFLGIGHAALGDREGARELFREAGALESRLGAPSLARRTGDTARRWLSS